MIEQQFIEKLNSFNVAPLQATKTIPLLPLNHGFYDGIVALLAAPSSSTTVAFDGSTQHQDSGRTSDCVVESSTSPMICEEMLLRVIRDLFSVFSGNSLTEDEEEHEKSDDLENEDYKDTGAEVEDLNDRSTSSSHLKWDLLSSHGITITVKLLVDVFTKFPNKFYTNFDERQSGILIHVLGTLLRFANNDNDGSSISGRSGIEGNRKRSSKFTSSDDKNTNINKDDKTKDNHIEKNINTLQIDVVKILCLPFALELDQTVLYAILCSLHQSSALESLLRAVSVYHRSSSNSSNNNNKINRNGNNINASSNIANTRVLIGS